MLHGISDGRIRFGTYDFSNLQLLPHAYPYQPLDLPGVYVILVFDDQWRPKPYRPLYVGESEDLWNRTTIAHEKYVWWQVHAGTVTSLYRAFYPLLASTRSQRLAVESTLIAQYNPPCNERFSVSLASLLGSG